MDDRVADYLLRITAGVLTAAGVVTVLIGYVQLRDEHEVALQLPFLMSAGIGGLILVGLGAMALIQVQMRIQARRFAELTDQLDEWKDAALAEIRTFLEGSEVEVEIQGPPVAPAVMASFRSASAR
jgi:hypothetical protein